MQPTETAIAQLETIANMKRRKIVIFLEILNHLTTQGFDHTIFFSGSINWG